MSKQEQSSRREVKSRSVQVFHRLAFTLVKLGLTPNQVSVLSAVFAGMGGACLFAASRTLSFGPQLLLLVGALAGIQLRLVCNLIDGLMAVEGGKKTPYGELFNDLPDRVSDIFLCIAAGYALYPYVPYAAHLGWLAATLAVLTAYVRVLGASMGCPHYFLGPMAKQHRMAVLNVGILISAAEASVRGTFSYGIQLALILIAAGSFLTCVRRARAIVRHLA
jgi:phosphatidylglycerophosphate synthase